MPDWGRDVLWYHATGYIAAYGWPADRVSSRWMLPAVAQVFDTGSPSVIRTITASWRLLNRRESQRQMADQLLEHLDQGRPRRGEDQHRRRPGAGRRRPPGALRPAAPVGGVIPSVRVTCSAPSHLGSAAGPRPGRLGDGDLNVDGFVWCDGRQADAMVLSLPMGRGLTR